MWNLIKWVDNFIAGSYGSYWFPCQTWICCFFFNSSQHEFSELLLGKLYNGDNIFNHANMFNSDNPVVVFIQVILSMSWYQPYQS